MRPDAGRSWLAVLMAAAMMCAAGCESGTGGGVDGSDGTPDGQDGTPAEVIAFTLTDVNPTSPTLGQEISPADHLGSITGWYFAHAS